MVITNTSSLASLGTITYNLSSANTGSYTSIAPSWPGYVSNNNVVLSADDVIVKNSNGKTINIVDTLEYIMESLCLVVPNYTLMEQYPALKAAYENHVDVMYKINSAMNESYNSYKTIEYLVGHESKNE